MPAAPRPRSRPVRLAGIATLLAVPVDGSSRDVEVAGVTLDSRSVLPGDLYAALPGHSTHGARFAGAAVRSGAVAILTDLDGAALMGPLAVPTLVVDDPRSRLGAVASLVYGHPSEGLQLIGITGTNGKTTVAAMVESGLRAAGRVTGMIGTTGVVVAGRSFTGVRTTPESTDLHAILGVMREEAVTSAVMEVSSIAIDEHRVDGVVYDVAAFTNLSQDHLDYHGSMEAYFMAKAALFAATRARKAVVGVDDFWGRRLASECTIPLVTWSASATAADWTRSRSADAIVINGPQGERQRIDVRMPGEFNLANALCAYVVLRQAGIDAEHAASGIARASVPGRMQVVEDGNPRGVVGIVDYAHSPDAIERVLEALDGGPGRVIAVLGAGGDRDRGKRPHMGSIAARLADVIVITDDNPRSEDPADIRRAIREGALGVESSTRAEVHEEADRARAITVAVAMAEAGDVVVVLGKGHEQGQEVGGVTSPFDDAAVLAAALRSGTSG